MSKQRTESNLQSRRRREPSSLRRAAPSPWLVVCLLSADLLVMAACSRNPYIIPQQTTARAQFEYALRLESAYLSPLRKESRVEDWGRAVAAFEKVMRDFPDDKYLVPRARLRLAMIQEKEAVLGKEPSQSRKALRTYETLIREYPNEDDIQINALYGAGMICDRLQKYEKAKHYYLDIMERYGDRKEGNYPDIVRRARFLYQRVQKK